MWLTAPLHTLLGRTFIIIATATSLLFLLTGIIPYQQQQQQLLQQLHYFNTVEAGREGECIDYDQSENTITINYNTSFQDVVQTINDPDVIDNLVGREYILKANLEVDDGVTFEMTSSSSNGDGGLQYLKIAGENGIIVHGRILIDGVKITSWDTSSNDIVQQNSDGSIRRAYIQFDESEGSQIINSEFGYLGFQEIGRRGFDLWGPNVSYSGEGSSHDMVIRGSKFHDM